MPAQTLTLVIQITDPAWRRLPRLRARLQQAAQATSKQIPASLRFPATATILLASDAKVRQLNFDFRGVNKPTNVLSFPQYLPQELRRLKKQNKAVELGDIALAYGRMAAVAKIEGKQPIDHATHLVIHGLLHLLGYDHVRDKDAKQMEKAEIKIMKSLDLPNPYTAPEKKGKTRRLKKN